MTPGGSSSSCEDNPVTYCDCCCSCNEETNPAGSGKDGGGALNPDGGQTEGGGSQTSGGKWSMGGGNGGNTGFHPEMSYNSGTSGDGGAGLGKGWMNNALPKAEKNGNSVLIKSGAGETRQFLKDGDEYTACYFVKDQLRDKEPGEGDGHVMTDDEGKEYSFDGDGELEEIRNPDGSVTTVTDESGVRTVKANIGTGGDFVAYEYHHSSPVNKIVYKVKDEGEITVVRTARFTYESELLVKIVLYDGSVEIEDNEIETVAFQYDENGRLEYVIGDHAWEMMQSVTDPGVFQPDVADYADVRYIYYTSGAVKTVTTKGGEYHYGTDAIPITYAISSHSGSSNNVWMRKTTVPQPDGTEHLYYFNHAGSVMLRTVRDARNGQDIKT